jgi:hypothetical protein
LKRLVLIFVALVAVGLPGAARAQDATPSIEGDVPGPEECTVEPMSLDRLAQLVATPVPEPVASPEASPTPFAMPEGQPADEATVAEITAAVRQFIACINAGDYARLLALYSDRAIAEIVLAPIGGQATAQEILDSLGAPQVLPDDQRTVLIRIEEVRVLPDGRVAALIFGDDRSNPRPPGPALVYFVEIEGRWLVDGFIPTEDIVTSEP